MRRRVKRWLGAYVLAAGILCAGGSGRAWAAITVTSFMTTAGQNAYAPFSKTQYYDIQKVDNASPAIADVSDDWTGTNVGGTTSTWHWVGASHIETSTVFDAMSLTVTGAGSFGYELTTTSGFVDPTRTGTVFTPSAAADYQCYFTLDRPATYRATGQIIGFGIAFLSSSEAGETFFTGSSSAIDFSGVIPPGHYEIRANASLAAGLLGNGVNDYAASGRFSDFSFSVQVPEPASIGLMLAILSVGSQFRRRG